MKSPLELDSTGVDTDYGDFTDGVPDFRVVADPSGSNATLQIRDGYFNLAKVISVAAE